MDKFIFTSRWTTMRLEIGERERGRERMANRAWRVHSSGKLLGGNRSQAMLLQMMYELFLYRSEYIVMTVGHCAVLSECERESA